MKSQNGVGLVQLVLIVIVLMLLLGVTAYVVFQDNGVIDKVEQNIIQVEENNEITEE